MPVKQDALAGEPEDNRQPEDQPKQRRKRRSKAEIEADNIASAKVPNDDDEVEVTVLEDLAGAVAGEKTKMLWPDALRYAREGKLKLSDKHEYARKRLDQEAQQRLDAEDAEFQGIDISLDEKIPVRLAGSEFDWSWRDVLKHVAFNHNDNLECVEPAHAAVLERAQANYEAEYPMAGPASLGSVEITDDIIKTILGPPKRNDLAPGSVATDKISGGEITDNTFDAGKADETVTANEEGEVEIERDATPVIEQTGVSIGGMGVWKVGMGYLEKIGLPDYSSLAIGPCTASTHVLDDGRRTTYEFGGRNAGRSVTLPTAVVEKLQEAGQICEAAMRAERQSMINFLEGVKPSVPASAPSAAGEPPAGAQIPPAQT